MAEKEVNNEDGAPGEEFQDNERPVDSRKVSGLVFEDEPAEEATENTADHAVPYVNRDKSGNSGKKSIFVRHAESMARHPWKHLLAALVVSISLSFIGLIVGNFSMAADNAGWRSRGTIIADRHTQYMLIRRHWNDLFNDQDGSVWKELRNDVQMGWELTRAENSTRRMVSYEQHEGDAQRHLSEGELMINSISGKELTECNMDWYGSRNMIKGDNVWSVWKTDPDNGGKSSISALDSDVLLEICEAETQTLSELESRGLCHGCPDGKCLLPYSLVMMVRYTLSGGVEMSCSDLIGQWPTIQETFTQTLVKCVEDMKENYEPGKALNLTSCPTGFWPSVVDEEFGADNQVVRYTSSSFPTGKPYDYVEEIYEIVDKLDRASGDIVLGAYETTGGDFILTYVDVLVSRDMALAMASAVITSFAILIHTGSPWLTLMGLFQIILSFPLAFFFYRFILQLEFFPFLNFIGVFVVFALGADDVFVAVDKWKNARLEMKDKTTEEIAAHALPDAAGAMFLTTITTAAAFFATTICPITALWCFAAFCGLLILFDYIMNIFIVFPALCLYDKWLLQHKRNCCIVCRGKKEAYDLDITRPAAQESSDSDEESADEKHQKPSMIHRILSGYFYFLHKFRWLALILSIAAMVICSIVTTKLGLPDSSDVELIADSHQFAQNNIWKQELLSEALAQRAGSEAFIIWGVTPADTGNHLNPETFTSLVLDESFNPRSSENQRYLVGFCDRWFDADFALKPFPDYECPINVFDSWLQEQSQSASPDELYTEHCGGASSVPVAEEDFDACIIAWSKNINEKSILQENGVVKIIISTTNFAAPFAASQEVLSKEWHDSENWMAAERRNAPEGANRMYHTSGNFWRYDTNQKLLETAYGAGGIALGCAAFILLISSRSFTLTFYSVISIGYVLVATMACLVGLGWDLGFLEAICLAILIGISCDFVIHFSHAYAMHPGVQSRHVRTKFALLHMGPSVLAAAVTTMAGAIIMLFTKILFFGKFAVVLFMTIVHSTVGSFFVFLAIVDCIGPTEPTKAVDFIVVKTREFFATHCCKKKDRGEGDH